MRQPVVERQPWQKVERSLHHRYIHPGKSTWNVKHRVLEDEFPFQMDDFQVPAVKFFKGVKHEVLVG